MIRKSMFLLATAALGTLIASQWPDLKRYVKIRQMSTGQGHPENVPAAGSIAYPQNAAGAAPDGTGEFDSARRGGPAQAA
jgi:hypothetical protein